MFDKLLNNYNNIFIDKEVDKINKLDLGFITNVDTISLYCILIHCVENIDIFNKEQKNNIYNYINKLSYE